MIDLANLYVRNHRNQQYMIVGAMMVALLGSLAPRYERALFVTGGRVQPTAFAAIAPPPVAFNGLFADAAGPYAPLRAARGGVPRGVERTGAVPDGLDPAAPANYVPGDASPVGGDAPLTQLAALDPSRSGIVGGPLAGSGPLSFGPGAAASGAPGNPATPDSPTTPGGGTGGNTTVPVEPVGPVPEPSTWITMLIGFFGLGALLRRSRRRSVQLEPIAGESDRVKSRKGALSQ